jgi:hypothetical protein
VHKLALVAILTCPGLLLLAAHMCLEHALVVHFKPKPAHGLDHLSLLLFVPAATLLLLPLQAVDTHKHMLLLKMYRKISKSLNM